MKYKGKRIGNVVEHVLISYSLKLVSFSILLHTITKKLPF